MQEAIEQPYDYGKYTMFSKQIRFFTTHLESLSQTIIQPFFTIRIFLSKLSLTNPLQRAWSSCIFSVGWYYHVWRKALTYFLLHQNVKSLQLRLDPVIKRLEIDEGREVSR